MIQRVQARPNLVKNLIQTTKLAFIVFYNSLTTIIMIRVISCGRKFTTPLARTRHRQAGCIVQEILLYKPPREDDAQDMETNCGVQASVRESLSQATQQYNGHLKGINDILGKGSGSEVHEFELLGQEQYENNPSIYTGQFKRTSLSSPIGIQRQKTVAWI